MGGWLEKWRIKQSSNLKLRLKLKLKFELDNMKGGCGAIKGVLCAL